MAIKIDKIISINKKAKFNYLIEDELEVGIVLAGTEVKSIREGKINLKDSYARIKNNEVYLYQMHVSPYSHAYYENHDPLKIRKLLLNKFEIKRLSSKVTEKGYALIPLNIYFRNGKVKLTLGLAKGKRLHDKRETLRKKDAQRELDRAKKDNK
ncbi:MAG: SsrA-binding protein SmpB [Desulfobacterales bacterium]|nr:SsrA-binding protein SmpB [Desulfobacterales bacterium]